MNSPEQQQSLHHEAMLHQEREHAIAQLIAAVEAADAAITKEWLYQTGQFSRVANPPSNYPPQGSIHGDLFTSKGKLRAALEAYRRTQP